MDTILLYSVSVSVGVSIFFLLVAGYFFNSVIPKDDRKHMDPLPLFIKLAWPLVRIFSCYYQYL